MVSPDIDFSIIQGSKDLRAELLDPSSDMFEMMQWLLARSISVSIGPERLGPDGAYRFARMDDPKGFREARIDPNYDVRAGRLRPNQSFHHPVVTVARHNGQLVGYAHAAGNVSGDTFVQRFLKRQGRSHNYTWFREIAVSPEYQRQGIGAALGALTLRQIDPDLRNPFSAYVITDAPAVNAFFDAYPDDEKIVRDPQEGPELGEGVEPLTVRPIVIPDSQKLFDRLNAIATR